MLKASRGRDAARTLAALGSGAVCSLTIGAGLAQTPASPAPSVTRTDASSSPQPASEPAASEPAPPPAEPPPSEPAPAAAEPPPSEPAPTGSPPEAEEKPAPKSEAAAEPAKQSGEAKPAEAKKKSFFKDPQDGWFDASQWLDSVYGFVPVPSLITEPALGGIGGALGLAFFGKRKEDQKIPPNIFVVGGGYTANESWFVGGGYRGFADQGRWRYGGGAFYAAPNLDLYYTLPNGAELSTSAEMNAFGGGGRVTRKIGDLPFYVGIGLRDVQLDLTFEGEDFGDAVSIPDLEVQQNQSGYHLSTELDTRNNFFSPTSGSHVRLDGGYNLLLGDTEGGYGDLYLAAHQFFDLERVVLGFRAVGNVILGDAPFYLRPYVSLRGVPVARYQGEYTITLETEEMILITQRIGVVVFGGWGKAMTDDVSFTEAPNAWNVGAGFRYLLARLYGLRMGVDVARGPEDWAWYIQFGHAWNGD